jgi:hypothetical protein
MVGIYEVRRLDGLYIPSFIKIGLGYKELMREALQTVW